MFAKHVGFCLCEEFEAYYGKDDCVCISAPVTIRRMLIFLQIQLYKERDKPESRHATKQQFLVPRLQLLDF
jgi:hypothetical protein